MVVIVILVCLSRILLIFVDIYTSWATVLRYKISRYTRR